MAWSFGRKQNTVQTKTPEQLFQEGKQLHAEGRYKESYETYLLAAKEGHDGAMNNIGCQYREGEGFAQDLLKAKEWFEKAYKAGSLNAAYNLGNLYVDGSDDIEQDFDKSFAYYHASAKGGYAPAMVFLAASYYEGLGCDINYKLTAYWALKSIQNGERDAYSILGELYKKGYYFPNCPAYARYCYEMASEDSEDTTYESFLIDDEDDTEINEQIRTIRPVKPNWQEIDDTYPEFETEKDPYQMWVEGSAYLRGKDIFGNQIKVNAKKGREILELAVKRGCVAAMTSLAFRYFDIGQGDGIIYNSAGAVESLGADNKKVLFYYEKAAECGDEMAIQALAELYTYGEYDIEPNKEVAKKYWNLLYELYQDEKVKKMMLDDFDTDFVYHKYFQDAQDDIRLEW